MNTYVMPERQWEKPKAEPLPAPEVVNRPATDDEIPRAALSMRKLAQAHGWTVVATYARGTRDGRPPRVVDSIALRLRRDDVRAWAVWLDGKFDAAQVQRPGAIPVSVTSTQMRAELQTQASVERAA